MHDLPFKRPETFDFRPSIIVQSPARTHNKVGLILDHFARLQFFYPDIPCKHLSIHLAICWDDKILPFTPLTVPKASQDFIPELDEPVRRILARHSLEVFLDL